MAIHLKMSLSATSIDVMRKKPSHIIPWVSQEILIGKETDEYVMNYNTSFHHWEWKNEPNV